MATVNHVPRGRYAGDQLGRDRPPALANGASGRGYTVGVWEQLKKTHDSGTRSPTWVPSGGMRW
jgi:hypothetical protein